MDKLQKHSSDETVSPQHWPSYLPILTAALSVLIAMLLIVATYPVFSQTCDEGAHLAAGMEWLDRGSYFYDPVNPPLPCIAIALGPEYQGHYLGILPFFWLACFVLWHFVSRSYGQWHAASRRGAVCVLSPSPGQYATCHNRHGGDRNVSSSRSTLSGYLTKARQTSSDEACLTGNLFCLTRNRLAGLP